jgi:hypothetical protein
MKGPLPFVLLCGTEQGTLHAMVVDRPFSDDGPGFDWAFKPIPASFINTWVYSPIQIMIPKINIPCHRLARAFTR